MKPIIITKNADGKIQMTEEELRRLLDETYANGYESGYKDGQLIINKIWQLPLKYRNNRERILYV